MNNFTENGQTRRYMWDMIRLVCMLWAHQKLSKASHGLLIWLTLKFHPIILEGISNKNNKQENHIKYFLNIYWSNCYKYDLKCYCVIVTTIRNICKHIIVIPEPQYTSNLQHILRPLLYTQWLISLVLLVRDKLIWYIIKFYHDSSINFVELTILE